MTRAGVLVAMLLAGAPQAASARPNSDHQKIDVCLKTAIERDTSGVECIGIVADRSAVNPH